MLIGSGEGDTLTVAFAGTGGTDLDTVTINGAGGSDLFALTGDTAPGVVTTLPGPELLAGVLEREAELAAAGGDVFGPDPSLAVPAAVCGAEGTHARECVRTIPPREHGGNMDIRYLGEGVTIYLPCYVAGCGLGVGDTLTLPTPAGPRAWPVAPLLLQSLLMAAAELQLPAPKI